MTSSANTRKWIRIEKRPPEHIDFVLIYAVIGLVGLVGVYIFPWIHYLMPPCAFNRLTGVPCPSCGMTRSVLALADFNLIAAFQFHPLFFVSVAILGALALISVGLYFSGRRYLNFNLTPTQWKHVAWLIGLLILINWVYLIVFLDEVTATFPVK